MKSRPSSQASLAAFLVFRIGRHRQSSWASQPVRARGSRYLGVAHFEQGEIRSHRGHR
jgi:hypothetical protein